MIGRTVGVFAVEGGFGLGWGVIVEM